MPVLILKALECNRTDAASIDINTRLSVSIDGKHESDVKLGVFSFRQRKLVNRSFPFDEKATVKLQFFVFGIFKKQIGDSLSLDIKTLPHKPTGKRGFHRGRIEFKGSSKKAGAHYYLWFEVIPNGMTAAEFHRSALPPSISLRQTLGRTGRGAMTPQESSELLLVPFDEVLTQASYLCSEVISLRDTFSLHQTQDGEKGNAKTLRDWIAQHCNIWGEESVIPIEQLPEGVSPIIELAFVPNWRPVRSERSSSLAGFCVESRFASEDNLATHMSRDWIFNIVPSPAFSYMLAYTAKTKSVANKMEPNAELSLIPLSHNEWESGSFPVDWRPVPGEYVTIFGRHVFDLGHLTMTTEIHPPHTIVREATIGNFNRAIIGMGFSGGFPGSVKAESGDELDARWNAEFGGHLEGLDVRHRRCWPTNLKKHPLKIQLFPPPRPASLTAKVNAIAREWKIITVREPRIDDFLKSCGAGGGEGEKKEHTFNGWFPETLQINPPAFKPMLSDRGGYFDLEIDLSGAQDIPVAYFAEVHCFWKD